MAMYGDRDIRDIRDIWSLRDIRDIRRILFFYTRRETDEVVTILEQNEDIMNSFVDFHKLKGGYDMKSSLEELPDVNVIKWLLGFSDTDLNYVFNILTECDSVFADEIGEYLITALEQMLLYDFSMESILLLRKDPRLSADTLHTATSRIDVPYATVTRQMINSETKKAFICYVVNCVHGEFAEQFLTEYLTDVDINKPIVPPKDEMLKENIGETILMTTLRVLAYTRECFGGLVKLILHLLSNPVLDINKTDNYGRPAIYRIADDTLSNPEVKIHILEAIMKRDDVNFNISTEQGKNIVTHFIDSFFTAARKSLARHRHSTIQDDYSAPRAILQCLVDSATSTEDIQSLCLLYFLQHPKFQDICDDVNTDDITSKEHHLGECITAIIKILLRFERLDINLQSNTDGQTVLMTALGLGTTVSNFIRDIVRNILVHEHLDINIPDGHGQTALVYAIKSNDPQMVSLILEKKDCNINIEDGNGLSPIMHSLKLEPGESQASILSQLAEHRGTGNLNFQDEAGNSILHILFENKKYTSILRALENIKNSQVADPLLIDIENNEHETVYSSIIKLRNATTEADDSTYLDEIFKNMLALPQELANKKLKHNRTLLHNCILEGAQSFTDILLSTGNVDINGQDDHGFTPLMYAVRKSNVATVITLLLNPLCDVTIKNKQGEDVKDLVNKRDLKDDIIRTLVTVIYARSTTTTAQTVLSSVSLDDQLKFLISTVNREVSFDQSLKDDISCQLTCIQSDISVRTGGRFGCEFKMADDHRRKLLGLRSYLCEEVMPRELFIHLISGAILTEDMVEEIEQLQTRRRMCEKLLSILPLRGERAFQSFIDALTKEKQGHVARRLLAFEPGAQQKEHRHHQVGTAHSMTVASRGYMGDGEPYAIIPLRFMPPEYPSSRMSRALDQSEAHIFEKE